MWYIVVYAAIILAVVQAEDKKKCMELMHPNAWRCCKQQTPQSSQSAENDFQSIYAKCVKFPKENCERDNCIGVQKGYLNADGKLDKATAEKITDDFSIVLTSESLNKIVNNCINGDLTIYGPPERCELPKFGACVNLQMIITCSQWDTSNSTCEDVKNLANECSKIFD